MITKKYLKIKDASRILPVPDFQIYELAHMGELKVFKVGKYLKMDLRNI